MTEENQKRRDFLTEIETIVHETFASQPMDDTDCVRCGRALDRGLVRIAEVVQKYKAAWPEHWQPAALPVQCTRCRRTVPPEQAYYVADLRVDRTVPQSCELLCDKCYAELDTRRTPSWMTSGRHG